MRREDESLMDANIELEWFIRSCRRLVRLYDDLVDMNARINTYGVSSPKIMTIDEAKYQKGTRIYSDVPLLELFAEEDALKREYKVTSAVCSLIKVKLASLQLSDSDLKILYYRYEKRYTYEQIAERLCYTKQAVQWHLDVILKLYSSM